MQPQNPSEAGGVPAPAVCFLRLYQIGAGCKGGGAALFGAGVAEVHLFPDRLGVLLLG